MTTAWVLGGIAGLLIFTLVLVLFFVWRRAERSDSAQEERIKQAEDRADEANQTADLRGERPMSPLELQQRLRDESERA